MTPALMDALSRDFPKLADCYFECGDGWEPIIRRLLATLSAQKIRCALAQVKSDAAVAAAESESAGVCEHCGQPGALRITRGQWLMTRCDDCWRQTPGRPE